MIGVAQEEKVGAAAGWLSEQNPVPSHVVHFIKTKFELSALQACEACKAAQDIRAGRGER
jgi:hypothetical protein